MPFDVRKYITVANVSLLLNVILAVCLYVVYKFVAIKPEPSKPNDDYKIIQDMADRNQKSISELQQSLQDLQKERQKSLEDYQATTQKILDSYEMRIKSLEKKRNDQIKKTTDDFKGNLNGLAKEFSNVTGIAVKGN